MSTGRPGRKPGPGGRLGPTIAFRVTDLEYDEAYRIARHERVEVGELVRAWFRVRLRGNSVTKMVEIH